MKRLLFANLIKILTVAGALAVILPGSSLMGGTAGSPFKRGDVNADDAIDILDPIHLLYFMFLNGPAIPCLDAADSNDDGGLDVSDPVYTLLFLFVNKEIPQPAPGPACGLDPTADGLECKSYGPCAGKPLQPLASFEADPVSGDAPLLVALDASASTDPDGQIRAYRWSFGDPWTSGTPPAGPQAAHVYLGSGNYTVRLTVTDDSGLSSTATRTIRVTGSPFPRPGLLHPITEEPYLEEELQRIHFLFQKFPNNSLLRSALIPLGDPARRAKEAAEQALEAKMTAGKAGPEEIGAYYSSLEMQVRDRLELVNSILAEVGWSEATRARYQRMRDAAGMQLANLKRRSGQSLAIYQRRQDPPPPPKLLATIDPAFLEVSQGQTALFTGKPSPGVQIQNWHWGLPTGEEAEGPKVEVPTGSLQAGQYRVVLEATDLRGSKSRAAAILSLQKGKVLDFDLAVISVEINEYPPEPKLADQANLSALFANLGETAAATASVTLTVDGKIADTVKSLILKPGERRLYTAGPLSSTAIFGHEVAIALNAVEPPNDPNPKNNQWKAVLTRPPKPPPIELSSSIQKYLGPMNAVGIAIRPPALVLRDLRLQTRPLPIPLGPLDGFADLHLHQMADLAYDGRFIWGAHDGPGPDVALAQCNGANHALCWLPGPVADIFKQWEAGSHTGLLSSIGLPGFLGGTGFCETPNWTGGPGVSIKGWNADLASEAFKHWPIWKTVTHQQVYSDWLESAHEQGLNLIIMSAINSRHLCGAMPAGNGFDPPHPFDLSASGSGGATDLAIRSAGRTNGMRNVRRQIMAAWQFASNHDWYEIALTPGQASQIIAEGRLAAILSIEESELFDNPSTLAALLPELDYFAGELGVRSIQPIHELNNSFGGAAYWNPILDFIQSLENEAALIADLLNGEQEASVTALIDGLGGIERDASGDNVLGLTALGEDFLEEVMGRNLLIDLSHMSKNASDGAYALAVANDYYPLFISHARYSDLLTANPFNDHLAKRWETIQQVKILGGMVGLRTSRDRMRAYLPSGVDNNCPGSIRDFAQSYAYGSLGYQIPQALASDMNGFIEQMRPRFADPSHPKYGTRAWACAEGPGSSWVRNGYQDDQGDWTVNGTGTEFDLAGFGRIDRIGSIIADLSGNLNVDTATVEQSADHFIRMWTRCYGRPGLPGDDCIDRSQIDGGPAVAGPLLPTCN
ncbi:MAG: PKD domain-containing protein [Planctomycetes bacterium]|nr:PKD domain-containing protein [Planctomycetota bacterium]